MKVRRLLWGSRREMIAPGLARQDGTDYDVTTEVAPWQVLSITNICFFLLFALFAHTSIYLTFTIYFFKWG